MIIRLSRILLVLLLLNGLFGGISQAQNDPPQERDPYDDYWDDGPEPTEEELDRSRRKEREEEAQDYLSGSIRLTENTAPDLTMCPETFTPIKLLFPQDDRVYKTKVESRSPDVAKGELIYREVLEVHSGPNNEKVPRKAVIKISLTRSYPRPNEKAEANACFLWVTVLPKEKCSDNPYHVSLGPLKVPPSRHPDDKPKSDIPKKAGLPGGILVGEIPPLGTPGLPPKKGNDPAEPPQKTLETPPVKNPNPDKPTKPDSDKPTGQTDLPPTAANPLVSLVNAMDCTAALNHYKAEVQTMAQSSWKPPRPPGKGTWETVLNYNITPNLQLSNISVVRSSGCGLLDESAISHLYQLKLPALPPCNQGQPVNVDHTFRLIYH